MEVGPSNDMQIELVSGPYNGRRIEDLGTVAIRMEIAERWPQQDGDKCGAAVYEPNAERTHAFWLNNVWDGTHVETIE